MTFDELDDIKNELKSFMTDHFNIHKSEISCPERMLALNFYCHPKDFNDFINSNFVRSIKGISKYNL